jgi:hypothetical protein
MPLARHVVAGSRGHVLPSRNILRTCTFFGGGGRIQKLGSHAKRRSLGTGPRQSDTFRPGVASERALAAEP